MLTNQVDKVTYQGNGSNVNFPITFDIIVSDLNETLVYIRDETIPSAPVITLQIQGSMQDYTLTGANPPTTPFNNNVQFNTAPSTTQKVILARNMPLTQLLQLLTSGTFDYQNIDIEFMRLVAMLQQINEITTRAPALNLCTQLGQLNIPEPLPNTVLGFDGTPSANLVLYPTNGGAFIGYQSETQVLASDNTSGQTLTGFSVNASTYSVLKVDVSILRQSTSGCLREVGQLILTYDTINSVWRISNPTQGPDLAGVTFAVSTASGIGTITFSTDSFSLGGSSYVGKIRYKNVSGFLVET